MSVHPITGDVNFHHLIKVMFARFLQICGFVCFFLFLSSHWLQQIGMEVAKMGALTVSG